VADELRTAAEQLRLPIERMEGAPSSLPRLLTLAAQDESRCAELRLPPLQRLRSLLPLGPAVADRGLALEVVVRADPLGPATVQDVEAQNRELCAYWAAAKHASPAVRRRLGPLIGRSRQMMDECLGLTLSVNLCGHEAPGWFLLRCLERRLGRDMKLDVAWVGGAPRWIPARADTLDVLVRLVAAW